MTTNLTKRIASLSFAGALTLSGGALFSACSDEDGDGGTTDEEIQEGEDTIDSVEDEIQEEIDSQDEGTNEDNE
jgi:hypothetical protein